MANAIKLSFSEKYFPQTVLGLLMILFIINPRQMPEYIASQIDTIPGMLFVFSVTVGILLKGHPILGVVAIVAATELVRRSGLKTGRLAQRMFANTENDKWSLFENVQELPPTLEQDVIKKRAGYVSGDLSSPTFIPYEKDADNAPPLSLVE